mgnify:FL=1
MFILTILGQEKEGAYAVTDPDGERALYIFEEEDDAERYAGLLEAEDYPEMTVIEIEEKVAISACYEYNYRYVIIKPNDFVVPPIDYDNIQTDKMA